MNKQVKKQDSKDYFQLSPKETLDGKDYKEYMRTVLKARTDPVYFIEDVLGFPGCDEKGEQRHLFPVQEQLVREFYRHKYYPEKYQFPYKKLIFIAGQRCVSKKTLILTLEYSSITIEDLFDKFHSGEIIHVRNHIGWVKIDNAFYVGFKNQYKLLIGDGTTIHCSKDHKFKVNGKWTPLFEIKTGDLITCYNYDTGEFYDSIVRGYDQEEFTCEMYDLHVPDGNCYVANGILSHNSGKTALISTIMGFELFETISWESPARHFGLMTGKSGKGATIGLTCLATSTKQADYGVFANMRNMIEENEFFDQWFDLNFRDQFIESKSKNVIAQVLAPHAGRAAGFTNKIGIFDELDFFQESETLLDVQKVYDKVCNSTETFKREGKIIAISSLNTATGIMMREYRDAKIEQRRQNPISLAYMYKTWEINPTLTEDDLRRSCGNNRIKFLRDFANQPEVGAGLQFPEGIITNSTITNLLNLDFNNKSSFPETVKIPHVVAIDPAWKNDSFGFACAYKRGNTVTVDGVRKFTKDSEAEAYIKPSDIRNFISSVIKNIKTTTLVYDVFNQSPELIEYIEDTLHIDAIEHIVSKEDYDRWRGMQEGTFDTNLQLVHDEQLIQECNELIVKQTGGGKIKVDHLHAGGKDAADTVANCIWYLEDDDFGDTKFTPLGNMMFV